MGSRKKDQFAAPDTLHVGDRVRLRFVMTDVEAVVTEYRGPFGANGEHIWGIRFPWGDEETYLELPTERLELIEPASASR